MSITSLFSSAKDSIVAKGSVYAKLAEADVLALEAKGRILVVDAANKVKHDLAALYEVEVNRVHVESEAVKIRFKAILALL